MSDTPKHGMPGHRRHDTACAGCAAEALGLQAPAGHSPPWRWVDGNWDIHALVDSAGKELIKAGSAGDMHIYGDDVRALTEAAPEMLVMLRELEWTTWGDDGPEHITCPVCGAIAPGKCAPEFAGHEPDCRLAALLARLPA